MFACLCTIVKYQPLNGNNFTQYIREFLRRILSKRNTIKMYWGCFTNWQFPPPFWSDFTGNDIKRIPMVVLARILPQLICFTCRQLSHRSACTPVQSDMRFHYPLISQYNIDFRVRHEFISANFVEVAKDFIAIDLSTIFQFQITSLKLALEHDLYVLGPGLLEQCY